MRGRRRIRTHASRSINWPHTRYAPYTRPVSNSNLKGGKEGRKEGREGGEGDTWALKASCRHVTRSTGRKEGRREGRAEERKELRERRNSAPFELKRVARVQLAPLDLFFIFLHRTRRPSVHHFTGPSPSPSFSTPESLMIIIYGLAATTTTTMCRCVPLQANEHIAGTQIVGSRWHSQSKTILYVY